MPVRALLRTTLLALGLVAQPLALAAADGPLPSAFEFLGEAVLATATSFDGEPVGGLSGLVWDAERELFLALSDDRAERGAVRYYELRIDLADGRLESSDLLVIGRRRLAPAHRGEYGRGAIDPEGFARHRDGRLFFASEGVPVLGVPPFVAELGRDGRERRRFRLPARFVGTDGVRDNLGFESLAVTPDGRFLVAGLENALAGDGPAADVGTPSPSRLLVWRLGKRRPPRELLYAVEPVSRPPATPGSFRVNGLVDLLALSSRRLLALEREWVEGVGARLRLFAVELPDELADLDRTAAGTAPPAVEKRLLLDLEGVGQPLDNFEAMALGPRLPDGRRTLVLLSDDNFDAVAQATRVWAFALQQERIVIAAVQGAAHRSPLEGQWLTALEGVVTAMVPRGARPGFFMESERPDGDEATSEGVRVEWAGGAPPPVGAAVRVAGRVVERSAGERQLTVTTLAATAVELAASGASLPPPPRWGSERRVPRQIDGDGLTEFRPERDAIDFWESLEGMRVELGGGEVSGPTSAHGELVLVPDGADPAAARTAAGGLRLTAAGPPLERVWIAQRGDGAPLQLAVGARLAGPLTGVVDYAFSNYKLLVHAPLLVVGEGASCAPAPAPLAGPGELRVGTFNVENLSAADAGDRFARLAEVIVHRLGGPEILALQEIQDDSGRAGGDGVVTARATLGRLVGAIRAAGGPGYAWTAIDPEPDREGGVPGGNIRVVLLYDSSRVSFVPRGEAGPLDATEPEVAAAGVRLTLNPGRVAPRSPAFDLAAGEGVRRSLAARFDVEGRSLFVIVNHWSSKFDDDRAFGAVQPPRRPTGAHRLAQARVVRQFAERLLAADAAAAVVVLGDFNDLPWSEAMAHLAAPPFVALLGGLPEAERYTYNFEGVAQAIDHVVVSPALAARAGIEAAHVNSDCPDARRTSDHDPVVARLRLRPFPPP